MRGEKNIER